MKTFIRLVIILIVSKIIASEGLLFGLVIIGIYLIVAGIVEKVIDIGETKRQQNKEIKDNDIYL